MSVAVALRSPWPWCPRPPPRPRPAPCRGHGSVQQVYAIGLTPHAAVSLLNRRGRGVATQKADSLGGIVFRKLAARPGLPPADGRQASRPRSP